METTPYPITWETFDMGAFEVVGLDCTTTHMEY